MKKMAHMVLLTSTFLSSLGVQGEVLPDKVVYGRDDRLEVFEAAEHLQVLARSAAVMVAKNSINSISSSTRSNLDQSLAYWDKFCKDEKYIDQPNPGVCSGFLIAPDLLVTAGHCAKVADFCSKYKWVFDFKVDKASGSAGLNVEQDDIYSCEKIISAKLDHSRSLDYAVVKLDRPVSDREPLEIRSQGFIESGEGIVVIGNPSGLPLKIAGGANVRSNFHEAYFKANLDTFQGNSGSAVFNEVTGVVEGILVRGDRDYVYNSSRMCTEVNHCADEGCMGESVSRLTSIPEIASLDSFHAAAISGDISTLTSILNSKVWIDMNGRDGQSALIKAAKVGQIDSLDFLIIQKADLNAIDAKGESALHHLARVMDESHKRVLQKLVNQGANLKLQNKNGETPLEVAQKAGNAIGEELLMKVKKKRRFLWWWR